jgi:hypothetical protein
VCESQPLQQAILQPANPGMTLRMPWGTRVPLPRTTTRTGSCDVGSWQSAIPRACACRRIKQCIVPTSFDRGHEHLGRASTAWTSSLMPLDGFSNKDGAACTYSSWLSIRDSLGWPRSGGRLWWAATMELSRYSLSRQTVQIIQACGHPPLTSRTSVASPRSRRAVTGRRLQPGLSRYSSRQASCTGDSRYMDPVIRK